MRNTARFFVLSPSEEMLILSALDFKELGIRVLPRSIDQVGHETKNASSGNKHFFTESCHRQTYQNYEQPPRTSQNLYFQSHFSVLKIFPKKIFFEKNGSNLSEKKYLTRRPTFIKKCF